MKLIIGLGNPEEKYKNNRHNVGHMFVDYLENTMKGKSFNEAISLAKTTTYMNESGKSVQSFMQKYRVKLKDLIVVHDDLDIPLGKFRIVKGYGPKLHNGIESIEDHLHTKDFLRVRIGVDNRAPDNRIPGIDYVLQDFTKEECDQLSGLFSLIVNLLVAEKHLA